MLCFKDSSYVDKNVDEYYVLEHVIVNRMPCYDTTTVDAQKGYGKCNITYKEMICREGYNLNEACVVIMIN